MKTTEIMFQGVLDYAKEYKKYEGKTKEEIDQEVEAMKQRSMPSLTELRELIYEVREQVDHIYAPLFVVQATNDNVVDPDSANVIYNATQSTKKQIKWYEQSGHVITLGPEKEQLHEDVFEFLESLNWNV